MTGRGLLSFWMPGGLLLAAAVVLVQTNALGACLPDIVRIYPYGIAAAGVLLGWRFNRSRLVFAVLMLAIADRSLLYFTRGAAASTDSGKLVYHAVSILLPLNLAILSLLKERGIVTAHGIWRICLILAQPLAIAAACRYRYYEVNDYATYPIIKASLLEYIPEVPLPQPALAAAVAAFLILACRAAWRRAAMENGFFWALPACLFALVTKTSGTIPTFYFSTAGLILVISVIESSYVMAFRDELTGLPARRALNEFLLKVGTRYTVAMVDIDFFKKFNDTYGHDVGDQVLRMVASRLADVTGGGKAFRYGGEEFTVIFPGKYMEEATPHLEQLRGVIESAGFTIRSHSRPRNKPDKPGHSKASRNRVSVTVSIGVAERNERYANPQDVIKAADKALYRAKKAGRNRVSI